MNVLFITVMWSSGCWHSKNNKKTSNKKRIRINIRTKILNKTTSKISSNRTKINKIKIKMSRITTRIVSLKIINHQPMITINPSSQVMAKKAKIKMMVIQINAMKVAARKMRLKNPHVKTEKKSGIKKKSAAREKRIMSGVKMINFKTNRIKQKASNKKIRELIIGILQKLRNNLLPKV